MECLTRDLSLELGRLPTETELAEAMGVSPDRWRRMAIELRTVGVVSATPNPDLENERPTDFAAAPDSHPDRMCERHQLQVTLARAMECLPERYQKVVFLYYTNEMTMKEIGDELGR